MFNFVINKNYSTFMKFKYLFTSLAAIAMLVSCSDDEPGRGVQPEAGKYPLSGKVEKGPFVRGSSISVQPLNSSLNAIGTVFNGEISDDAGTFNLGQIELASQFVRITTDGYYFNEVTGNLSSGTLHLVALADLSDRSSVNVNILTHLKSARIHKLMQGGVSFAAADKQAHKELLTQFGLQSYEKIPAETMSISAGTDGSGILIAISSIILSERTEAEVTQYLSKLSQDLADDGAFTEANMISVFQGKNRVTANLENISQNIKDRYAELGMSVTVPDLRYFFDWNNDGIAGNEISDNVQVSLSQNEINFSKAGGEATVTVTSNVPLTLEKFSDPYGDGGLNTTPEDQITTEYVSNVGFFEETGTSIECEYSFENNVLSIKVAKTEKRFAQSVSIPLYDMMGVCRATVKVSLDGDPSIVLKLGNTGKAVISSCFSRFAAALSWMFYVERGYTGMYKYYDVSCPLSPNDAYNYRAFSAAYGCIAQNNNVIDVLEQGGYTDATAFFRLLNAIVYTEMVDKWGNIGVPVSNQAQGAILIQQSAEVTLRYIENQLDNISSLFTDRKADKEYDSAESVFDMSKDVWRIAKANVYMALGQLSQAMPYLQQLVDSHRYSVSSGNEYTSNEGTILHLIVPDEVMQGHTVGYYTYADVLLMLAECYVSSGYYVEGSSLIGQVANAKSISLSGNNIDDIASLRKQLFIPRYFAFQKRNNLGGYAAYQFLWPLPNNELSLSGWTQNPGY